MLPALALSFGMSAGQGILGGLQNKAQIEAQNKLNKQQNRLNAMEAAYSIANIKGQQVAVRKQATSDLHTAQRMASTAMGDVTTQAAAAGVKGASVDAVAQDIDIELGRANAEIRDSAIVQDANLNEQIRSLAVSTRLNMATLQKAPSTGSILLRAGVSGAMSTGAAYATQYMRFGAGGHTTEAPAGAPARHGWGGSLSTNERMS